MFDPWDVTGTRHSDQYVSCMKINGVPLLPPVLSNECRKEMQYYKALALEVEKRISVLKSAIEDSDCVSKQDSCIYEYNEFNKNEVQIDTHIANNNDDSDNPCLALEEYSSLPSVTIKENSESSSNLSSPKLVIGVISDVFKEKFIEYDDNKTDKPERDGIVTCFTADVAKSRNKEHKEKENISPEKTDICDKDLIPLKFSPTVNIPKTLEASSLVTENVFKCSNGHSEQENIFPEKIQFDEALKFSPTKNWGPSSLVSSKSFDDIHTQFSSPPKLVRQRSYTILKPGPALLAHLEVRSMTAGVEMSSISMSESCSNLTFLSKKRKSWDLETAKEKWSNMATELNTKENVIKKRTHSARQNLRSQHPKNRTRSLAIEKSKRNSRSISCPFDSDVNTATKIPITIKTIENCSSTKKEAKDKSHKVTPKYIKLTSDDVNESHSKNDHALKKYTECSSSILPSINYSPAKTNQLIQEQDPTARIRELYEKIRQQQVHRMTSLIEKQKKEKQFLEQMFEEQNALFYKQIKTICPTSPTEVKEAWTEKEHEQPVSLSQLINETKPNVSVELSSALNDSQTCLSKTEEVLQKSRRVRKNSSSKIKQGSETSSPYSVRLHPKSAPSKIDRSPISRNTTGVPNARKYLTSDSSCKSEVDPILTDRTDNTMADLNFTLTSDENGECYPQILHRDCTFIMDFKNDNSSISKSQQGRKSSVDSNIVHDPARTRKDVSLVVHSPRSPEQPERRTVRKLFADKPPTDKEKVAASRIVAFARGYLTRRLLRTERVQTTVQTIRDALVCAIQLHQDREGIRGADVDLHRRLIQQITAACYSLHDTFVGSTPRQRCALIAQDRERLRTLEEKQMSNSFSSRPLSTPTRRSSRRKS